MKNTVNSPIYKELQTLRKEIALSDDPQEKELKSQQMADLRAQLAKSGKKDPVIVSIKKAPTVGDKLEQRIAAGGKGKNPRLGQTRVRI